MIASRDKRLVQLPRMDTSICLNAHLVEGQHPALYKIGASSPRQKTISQPLVRARPDLDLAGGCPSIDRDDEPRGIGALHTEFDLPLEPHQSQRYIRGMGSMRI
jgi:hypothetical protein